MTELPREENHSTDTEPQDVPLPEPTITALVSGLATQAMISMGVFPNPGTGKATMLLHQAKHLIDTVGLLVEKTAGNLDPTEAKTIDSILHELRMIFVAAQNEKKRREEAPPEPESEQQPEA